LQLPELTIGTPATNATPGHMPLSDRVVFSAEPEPTQRSFKLKARCGAGRKHLLNLQALRISSGFATKSSGNGVHMFISTSTGMK
jgi:hypothetical protein